MLLRNEHEAEDAAQQTFLAAYRSIRNGIEPRHPAAWLATIARNECWAAIEHRMRQPVHQGEPESGLPDPVVQAAANADLEELWRAIGELPRQQRQALLLREFSGLTYAELAGALGVTEPAVESLLVRARRALRRRLRPLSGSAAAVTAPLVTLRDALARLLLGMPDAPSASGLSKLAAGAAAAVVAGGTVVAVESHDVGRAVAMPAKASALPTAVPRAAVRRAVVTRRTPTTSRATTRSPRHVQSVRPKRLASPASRPVSAPAVSAPRPEPLPAPSPQRGAAPSRRLPPLRATRAGRATARDPAPPAPTRPVPEKAARVDTTARERPPSRARARARAARSNPARPRPARVAARSRSRQARARPVQPSPGRGEATTVRAAPVEAATTTAAAAAVAETATATAPASFRSRVPR
jgi:RNA polymerase sigma-70 factor (ECF subfamily)